MDGELSNPTMTPQALVWTVNLVNDTAEPFFRVLQASNETLFIGRSNDVLDLVVDISSINLSPVELSVLQKGLPFCPTPMLDKFTLEQEVQRLYWSKRLKAHFAMTKI